ncbi:MAG TPA: hypothetical protein PKJ50_16035 [Casimicrobium huifangae]|nr:hypothetical protein [Casimicrobium huifangae]
MKKFYESAAFSRNNHFIGLGGEYSRLLTLLIYRCQAHCRNALSEKLSNPNDHGTTLATVTIATRDGAGNL